MGKPGREFEDGVGLFSTERIVLPAQCILVKYLYNVYLEIKYKALVY